MSCLIFLNIKYIPENFDKWTKVDLNLMYEQRKNLKNNLIINALNEFVIESDNNIKLKIGGNKYIFNPGKYYFPYVPHYHDIVIELNDIPYIKIYVDSSVDSSENKSSEFGSLIASLQNSFNIVFDYKCVDFDNCEYLVLITDMMSKKIFYNKITKQNHDNDNENFYWKLINKKISSEYIYSKYLIYIKNQMNNISKNIYLSNIYNPDTICVGMTFDVSGYKKINDAKNIIINYDDIINNSSHNSVYYIFYEYKNFYQIKNSFDINYPVQADKFDELNIWINEFIYLIDKYVSMDAIKIHQHNEHY